MAVARSEELPIRGEDDVVRIRQVSREWSIELGFSLVDQTKLVTAASELARNTIIDGGGGTVELQELNGTRRGLRLVTPRMRRRQLQVDVEKVVDDVALRQECRRQKQQHAEHAPKLAPRAAPIGCNSATS